MTLGEELREEEYRLIRRVMGVQIRGEPLSIERAREVCEQLERRRAALGLPSLPSAIPPDWKWPES